MELSLYCLPVGINLLGDDSIDGFGLGVSKGLPLLLEWPAWIVSKILLVSILANLSFPMHLGEVLGLAWACIPNYSESIVASFIKIETLLESAL